MSCHQLNYRLVVLALLFITLVGAKRTSSKIKEEDLNCDTKNNDKIDRKMAQVMVFGEHGRKYPEDRKQLKNFCEESNHLLNYIDSYKGKCFKGTLKQFSSIFIYSNRNSMKRFCGKNNKQVPALLSAAKCVNRHMGKLSNCMGRLTESFMGIKYAEERLKVPHICCSYVALVGCFGREMRKTECRSETDTILDFVRSLMGNFVDSTCGDYSEETDRCAKLGKPPKRKSGEKVPKSILYPLFDIINSIPQ